MEFHDTLQPAVLERRYQRFLADVVLPDGRRITVHCPNTGSMLGCAEPGSRVWLSRSDNPGRKYAYTWELVETLDGVVVGVHTGRANALVREALEKGVITELAGYHRIRNEVRSGAHRLDFCLEGGEGPCHVEVKNVTAAEGGTALFPDAVSARGTRHLYELMRLVEAGGRAALVFCVQRADVHRVRSADEIDPDYGVALRRARLAGVTVLAYGAEVTTRGVRLDRPLPVDGAPAAAGALAT